MLLPWNKDGGDMILKDIHCPYCDTEHAILLSRPTSKEWALRLPAFGLKFLLCLLYLGFIQIFVHGYKYFELTKRVNYTTYAFCPNCGNSFSMAAPETVRDDLNEPKLYKNKHNRAIMGLCSGISEYTGISLLWIRILTFIYGLTVIGAILYFLIGACLPFREDAEDGITYKKLRRARTGRDVTGLCRGFSEYTGIPVGIVRVFALLLFPLYFIASIFVPVQEDAEHEIRKRKLSKVKEKKFLVGVCAGISAYTGMPLWLVRLLTIILIVTWPLYWIAAAVMPNEE